MGQENSTVRIPPASSLRLSSLSAPFLQVEEASVFASLLLPAPPPLPACSAFPSHHPLFTRGTYEKFQPHQIEPVKQVYDIIPIGGGGFLNNIKNSLNGLHFGFGIPSEQIQIAAALHGPANMLNMDDYVWKKYKIGEWFKVTDPETGQPAERNIFYPSKHGLKYASSSPDSPDSLYQDTSIQALQHRGVRFLCCHTAVEEQARKLIQLRNLSQKPEEIAEDWLSHVYPGVLVVAAQVAAIALLQTEGHYSYITVG
jgi:intracellular sulfur oxidation DsrE/DsrF family protein